MMTMAENVARRHLEAKSKPRVDVKITGWGGKRKIPKKDLDAFRKDVRTIPEAGFLATWLRCSRRW